nr:hypothetical protein [uncultured Desulfuromonas sp.]
MKRTRTIVSLVIALLLMAGLAQASLSGFMTDMNMRARADLRDFSVRLSTHFGVPVPDVDRLLRRVTAPADAFMCLQLSDMSRVPMPQVMERYRNRRDKGWGQLAQDLGIKPGSAQFHRIRQGNFVFYADSDLNSGRSKNQGKNKSNKGKGQGNNKGAKTRK